MIINIVYNEMMIVILFNQMISQSAKNVVLIRSMSMGYAKKKLLIIVQHLLILLSKQVNNAKHAL